MLPITALALFGAGELLLVTSRWGIGVTPDSVNYLQAAHSLAAGQRPRSAPDGRSATHFPPLYPAALALGIAMGLDGLVSARWASALLFGANILSVGLLIHKCLPNRPWMPILGSLVALTCYPMLYVHRYAWSEPLFLCCCLVALLSLAQHLASPRWSTVIVASVAAGLACLTRYAGAALVIAGLVTMLRVSPWKRRVKNSVVFATIASLPTASWILWGRHVTGAIGNRDLAFHPTDTGALKATVAAVLMSLWVPHVQLPGPIAWSVVLAVLAAIIASAIAVLRRHRALHGRWLPKCSPTMASLSWALIAFLGCYEGFLVLSASLLDAAIPFDVRLNAPAAVAVLLLVLPWGALVLPALEADSPRSRHLVTGLVIVVAGIFAARAASWMVRSYAQGEGYTSALWQRSAAVEHVRALPEATTVYTTHVNAIWFCTGKPARGIPRKVNPMSLKPNPHYGTEMDLMVQEVERGSAEIVVVPGYPPPFCPSPAELERRMPLQRILDTGHEVIYRGARAQQGRTAGEGPMAHRHALGVNGR